jgi:hypothetical protein
MPSRRFPPPWSAEVTPNCFIVRDADGQQLAYVYYESEPGRRSAAKLLTKDEVRRIAANIAKLPGASPPSGKLTCDTQPIQSRRCKSFFSATATT